jgi:hypothetical protein
MPYLRVDDSGLTCTLTFDGTPFFCVVPWSSVFALGPERGRSRVWGEDVPEEIVRPGETERCRSQAAGRSGPAVGPAHPSTRHASEADALHCSFCGKAYAPGRRFIAGPSVRICNQCLELCRGVLDDEAETDDEHASGGVAHDELRTSADAKKPPRADKRPIHDVIGREAVGLVRKANELHALIAELDDCLRRTELDLERALSEELDGEPQSARRADPERERSQPSASSSKLDQLYELMGTYTARRERAYWEWDRVASDAAFSLSEQVGLETRSPPPPRSHSTFRRSRPAFTVDSPCSFCGMSPANVKRLIAGRAGRICDACIRRADQISRARARVR